jgi:2,4-dienoyl-CoA reductase-like NADH-dependent reductase (Old Yellow Enzyme family)
LKERNVSYNFKNLFTPVKIASMELKNRVVMPAIATGYGNNDSTVSDRLIKYLERRAQGGAGLIITEVCAIDPRGKGFGSEIGVWDDSFIPELSRLTAAIHKYDSKIALQLHHAGRETMKAVTGKDPEAPSDIPSVIFNQPVEAMTIDRVNEIVNAYAEGALRAKQAGFDAVEIHEATV